MSNSLLLSPSAPHAIVLAASKLSAGYLVAFPTETVYGLGADASNENAIKRIYEVKGRPTNHPLIVHISSMNVLTVWAREIPEYAITLARDFWPGPMTLVLKRTKEAKDFITGDQDSVALRVPSEPVALALLQAFEKNGGKGIAAPSANRFGQVSATSAQDVFIELGSYLNSSDLILDGGRCSIGIESTIIDCTKESPQILRPGAITTAMIATSVGVTELKTGSADIRVSGALEKHYSPLAKVILDQSPEVGQGFIALSYIPTPLGVTRIAAPKNAVEFAQTLYESLRKADELNFKEIVIVQPGGQNIEIGIRDRLAKAAVGR